MVEQGLILLYDQDEEGYEDDEEVRSVVQIVDWWEYQKLKDPQPSRFEPHEDWDQDRASLPRDEFGKYR